MRYYANPVEVTAHQIISVEGDGDSENLLLSLDNGTGVTATRDMVSRHRPIPGDYWVIQEDGYLYINPKMVFERKYSKVGTKTKIEARESSEPATFPKWKYHAKEEACVVNNAFEENKLGSGWYDTPTLLQKAIDEGKKKVEKEVIEANIDASKSELPKDSTKIKTTTPKKKTEAA